MSKKCSAEGCENKHYGKGYCVKHYTQLRRYGHILERTIHDSNEIIEYEDYAEIVLYNKKCEEIARAIIDLEYVDSVKKYKWYLSHGYARNDEVGFLHRYIMNPSEDLVIDHINRNPLDNRRENLRICTQQENQFNHSVHCNNTSGSTGVYWHKNTNKWIAQIVVNGEHRYLGGYKSKEEATNARKQAEIEYFGEYAPSNE